MTITVSFNGELCAVPANQSLARALRDWGYGPEDAIAVAVNGDFVLRANYASLRLRDRDCIDVVAPVQGG